MDVFSEVCRIALIILINVASVSAFYWPVSRAHSNFRHERKESPFFAYFQVISMYFISATGILAFGIFSVAITGGLLIPGGSLGVDPEGAIYQGGLYYKDTGAVVINTRGENRVVCYYNVRRYNPLLPAGVCTLHYSVLDESLLLRLHEEFPDIGDTRNVSQYFQSKLHEFLSQARTVARVEANIRDMCVRLRRCGIESDVELTIVIPGSHYEYQKHLDHTPLPL